jgi:hypothetical protein
MEGRMPRDDNYSSPYEMEYCAIPENCLRPDVLFLGSAVGLSAAAHLAAICPSSRSGIVVADAGGLDLLTHVSNMDVPRFPLLKEAAAHFGGKLCLWGTSAPRPPIEFLARFPYAIEDLDHRFSSVESELGVADPIPYSGRRLESDVCKRLKCLFPDHRMRPAPLAIDRFGRRWSSVSQIPDLASDGVKFLARFRCTHLHADARSLHGVRGTWLVNGREYVLEPQVIVMALGVEQSLPLVRQLCPTSLPIEAADHIRIDLHGSLPAGSFGDKPIDELGVAVFLMEGLTGCGIPYHFEVKVAPRALWRRFMPSGDNLRGRDAGHAIYVQIQAIAAMHDRLPAKDLLNVGPETAIPPVMSARDAAFHGNLVSLMSEVAKSLGLSAPTFSFRPLLANHHLYGAFRVGKAVSKEFLFDRTDNLYILPPTSYVDLDDDANPTLKSLVLAQYAMESIARRFVVGRG